MFKQIIKKDVPEKSTNKITVNEQPVIVTGEFFVDEINHIFQKPLSSDKI